MSKPVKTTKEALELIRDMIENEEEDLALIHNLALQGLGLLPNIEKYKVVLGELHNIIINILTDSQLDTRLPCGQTIRNYRKLKAELDNV